jgi:hypothetical protein
MYRIGIQEMHMNTVRMVEALLIAALTGIGVGMTQVRPGEPRGTPDVVQTRSLELVGADGQIRGRFNVEEDGAVVLRLLDERGTIRVKLGAEESGSGLLLANQATEPGIHLLATAKGSSIRVANQDGRQQLIAP